MSPSVAPPLVAGDVVDRHAQFNKRSLFIISIIALVTAGAAAVLRANISPVLQHDYMAHIDPSAAGSFTATCLGVAFLGFAFSIAIGSPFLDLIGMGRVLVLSSLCFLVGTGLIETLPHVTAAHDLTSYHWLYAGCLLSGIGWGLVETVINPLIATLYPQDKTTKLNILHAWWPGGQIIGGLIGLGISELGLDWHVQYGFVALPALLFGILALTVRFPRTERSAAGVSTVSMFKELASPLFIVFFCAMFLTAASELAPGQWVNIALSTSAGINGIWLLVYVAGVMFIMRNCVGALAHRMSPVSVLWFSCLLAAIGLYLLSLAYSPVTAILAATVWAIGVCFMWPTMLGAASERFPRGGALLMGLMGTAGTLSIAFFLPQMGRIYDDTAVALAENPHATFPAPPVVMGSAIAQGIGSLASVLVPAAPGAASTPPAPTAFDRLNTAADAGDPAAIARRSAIQQEAGRHSFAAMAVVPCVLLVVFGAIWFYDRRRGGYRPVVLVNHL